MHGFRDSNFAFLRGLEVEQACLGQFQTQIHFCPQGRIYIEGQYVHGITSEGREIVQLRSSCGPNELYRLLGQSVTDVVVLSDSTLRLSFSNEDTLALIDDTDQYESFVITFNQDESSRVCPTRPVATGMERLGICCMAKGMPEMTTWWMPLGLAILFFSVGCDRIEQRVVSPDGQTTAEVITSSAPATDAETTYVKLSAKSSSGRHLVFGGSNYGATITVAWTDAKNLTIQCENCDKLQKRVTDEDRWHDIMIHYELR